jgi:hypothetical protein
MGSLHEMPEIERAVDADSWQLSQICLIWPAQGYSIEHQERGKLQLEQNG